MDLSDRFWQLLAAAGLGLLVGLQREQAAAPLAGLRTFSLITIFGWVAGVLGVWAISAGLLGVAALLLAGSLPLHRDPGHDPGLTTEVAALLMFGVGALIATGEPKVAIAAGAATAALLAFKIELHRMVAHLAEGDVKAIMQFALLSAVILPVLPDRTFGPYDILNPRQVWWMVVLIVGLGLVGYIAHKFAPSTAGLALSGFLGGLVSSTATTVAYARRVRAGTLSPQWAAMVVLIASTVVFGRLIVEIAATAPGWLPAAAPPLGLLAAVMLASSAWMWRRNREAAERPPVSNPSQLKAALLFAGGYALVLLAAAVVRQHIGDAGLYAVAAISGLTDVDAVTLSTAQLVSTGRLDGSFGWRVVLVAALANLVSKAGYVAALGAWPVLSRIAAPFLLTIAAGVALILFWS